MTKWIKHVEFFDVNDIMSYLVGLRGIQYTVYYTVYFENCRSETDKHGYYIWKPRYKPRNEPRNEPRYEPGYEPRHNPSHLIILVKRIIL